eukprot:TRINITY_DN2778_c0_g1_i1.p1 TRINITY_DN2778_c0_g1~~TRINITY_DN2778_c0_g1_i1.p1  ORF type:complete len:126 (+),score=13.02 TRINITY_DN2778_c0_g1_i1:186-563(+)
MLLVLIILYLFLLKRWGFLAVHNDMMVNVIVIWMTSVVITAVWVVTIGGVRATASAAALHNACEWHWMYTLLFQSKQGNKTVDSTPQKGFLLLRYCLCVNSASYYFNLRPDGPSFHWNGGHGCLD